jgi:tRNA (guanine10-N2)-dimethyltransferase
MSNIDTLCILGRQPDLGLAELESLYGASAVSRIGHDAALVHAALTAESLARLGGTVKLAHVVDDLPTTQLSDLIAYLRTALPNRLNFEGSGKLNVGLSTYGLIITPPKLLAAGLELKKALRQSTGRSVRLVSSKDELHLNSPQIIHNQLDTTGYEILLVASDNHVLVARTFAEQDIAAYTHRDQERPKRDAKVGMLPPKLAQIIVNLAVATMHPSADTIVLDPFCGTGVILQEASLMGFGVAGSDLEPRMVSFAKDNLAWLSSTFGTTVALQQLAQGDATSFVWTPAPQFVACETYLGRPFTARPTPEILAQTASEVNLILRKFLQNIHGQLKPGSRLCVAVPAWQTAPDTFRHLPLIDQISDLGYNRVSFEHVLDSQLLYYREDQYTARELLVLTRK